MATQKKVAKKGSVKSKPVAKKVVGKPLAKKPVKKAVPVKKSSAHKPLAKKSGLQQQVPKKPPVKKATVPSKAKSSPPRPVLKPSVPTTKPAANLVKKKKTQEAENPKTSVANTKAGTAPAPKNAVAPKTAPAAAAKSGGISRTPPAKLNRRIAEKAPLPKLKRTGPISKPVTYRPEFVKSVLDQPEQGNGPIFRYSDSELSEFKEIILKKMESARKELAYLQGLITRKDETGTEDTESKYMSMEDGSGTMEREQLNQMASRQIQFIDHLEKALMRIENKTYGICRVTGKLIDKARLRAVPHATLSIEAKQAMSK